MHSLHIEVEVHATDKQCRHSQSHTERSWQTLIYGHRARNPTISSWLQPLGPWVGSNEAVPLLARSPLALATEFPQRKDSYLNQAESLFWRNAGQAVSGGILFFCLSVALFHFLYLVFPCFSLSFSAFALPLPSLSHSFLSLFSLSAFTDFYWVSSFFLCDMIRQN